jgi:hypothetical protein
MPDRSGFDMSLAMNSSGARPGRSSHSGIHPAPGASRVGGADVSRSSVEAASDVVVVNWTRGAVALVLVFEKAMAAGVAAIKDSATSDNLIVSRCSMDEIVS